MSFGTDSFKRFQNTLRTSWNPQKWSTKSNAIQHTHETRFVGQNDAKKQLKSSKIVQKMSCGRVDKLIQSKSNIFAVGNMFKIRWKPRNRYRKTHAVRHSLRGLMVSKYAKNQLKTKILSKTLFWDKMMKNLPQVFKEFLAMRAACRVVRATLTAWVHTSPNQILLANFQTTSHANG